MNICFTITQAIRETVSVLVLLLQSTRLSSFVNEFHSYRNELCSYRKELTELKTSLLQWEHQAGDTLHVDGARVVSPLDVDYDDARRQYATLLDTQDVAETRLRPDYIVYCTEAHHVQETIAFCRGSNYHLSVRSGGHQYCGYSGGAAGTIVLDVSGLQQFVSDGKIRVTVGVGLTVDTLNQKLGHIKMVVPVGVCGTVRTGGHFSSSAIGYLVNAYGSGMDFVHCFRIVLADGTIQTVTKKSNPDLFWAVLGGPPGSWGVVLDYTVDCLQVTDHPHCKQLKQTWKWDEDLFFKIQMEVHKISMNPDAVGLTLYMHVTPLPFVRKVAGDHTHYIYLGGVWSGDKVAPDCVEEAIRTILTMDTKRMMKAPSPAWWVIMPLSLAVAGMTQSFDNRGKRYLVDSRILDATKLENDNGKYFKEMGKQLAYHINSTEVAYIMYQAFSSVRPPTDPGSLIAPVLKAGHWFDLWTFFEASTEPAPIKEAMATFEETLGDYTGDEVSRCWLSTDTRASDTSTLDTDWEKYIVDQQAYTRLKNIKQDVDPNNIFRGGRTVVSTHPTKD